MFYKKIGKRIIDVLISLNLLLIFCPFFIIIGILIRLDSKGEVIFKHKRLGKNCKPIYVWKFRTMINNAMEIGPQYTSINDSRITKIGNILRKTSIDELPQIMNILIGDMSLVGPRPDAYIDNPSDYQKKRTKILPGITGLAQVNGRSLLANEQREKYDLFYVDNYSFKIDLKIVLKTIKIILKQDGVN